MKLLLLALAPALIIMVYIYVKDKYEKEPIKLLLTNFGLGASASIVLTFILSAIGKLFFSVTDPLSVFQQFIKAFVIVALVEELSKYLIVRYVAQRNSEFNEPFDGIVYAVMVSMGFATLENILYVFQFGFGNGLLRAFTAVPAHATFGILMGYFMGLAKFSNKKAQLNLTGLLMAVLFHGAYDFFLFVNFIPGLSFGAFASLVIAIILSRKAIKKHQDRSHFEHKGYYK
uniref:PrsW family intramembrane metalloprotease n=1 Tax=Polaribacter sp. TaxID=1920175 RepID=UPI0040482E16